MTDSTTTSTRPGGSHMTAEEARIFLLTEQVEELLQLLAAHRAICPGEKTPSERATLSTLAAFQKGLVDELLREVIRLEKKIDALREEFATEVRTRRLVVEGPDGYERITASADIDSGTVSVNNRRHMHVALVADESDPQGAVELYLSAGGNGAAAFGVVEHGAVIIDTDQGRRIDPDTVEYVTALSITPDTRDPRSHDIRLDRNGLSFGG